MKDTSRVIDLKKSSDKIGTFEEIQTCGGQGSRDAFIA